MLQNAAGEDHLDDWVRSKNMKDTRLMVLVILLMLSAATVLNSCSIKELRGQINEMKHDAH
jgi:hypothetical protein